jgi:hypothetical protein
MHALQVRRTARALRRAILTMIASALVALLLAPSASAQTTPLHLTVLYLDFTSYSCRVDEPLVCDVTITGPVRSNLGHGTADYTVVLTWEGFEGSPCNTVDETVVFTFDTGTIITHAVHRDCPATIRPGPRIMGTFTVTGGTGAFAGATGSGAELSAPAENAPVVYNGTIAF